MEETESSDTYVTQLKEVFDSCDTTGNGYLQESELQCLCEKLHISEHSDFLIGSLLENRSEVKFEDFKECFVVALTQSMQNEMSNDQDDNADREVSPKFTLGRKKYGRRSRPSSMVDDDDISPTSSPVLSPQDSTEQCALPSKSSRPNSSVECSSGKRPMSPSSTQQPPTKSGRMFSECSLKSDGQLENSVQRQPSDSDSEMNHSFDSNPAQYLQDTWKKLGIGQEGYLNVDELSLVCEHIGMDMSEEVVAQLFEKLDCDQDGQISFEEFVQGLFHHGDVHSCDSPVSKSDSSKPVFQEVSRDDHEISNSCVSGIFSCIDPENTGYADAASILELWESLELPCSSQLLQELGFNVNLKINLADLTSALEEVLVNGLTTPLQQLAYITCQNELQFLRQVVDQMQGERNKLRISVDEANARAALLAQEVDDNHAKLENSLQSKLLLMEKKYQEQAKELVEELQQEREVVTSQTSKLKLQLQEEVACIREEEAKLKNRLTLLEQENVRLEQELQESTEKYLEAEKLNDMLQKELAIVPNLKERLADLESHHSELQEHEHQSLIMELDKYKAKNQELQDNIDELTLEMESLQQHPPVEDASSTNLNRTHSWLSDYKKATTLGSKRRGSESSSDDNSDDENPTSEKVRRTFLSLEEKSTQNFEFQDDKANVKNVPSTKDAPSAVDYLLTDMFMDHVSLMQKLQVAEEKQMKAERDNRVLLRKYQMLNRFLVSGAIVVPLD